MNYVIKKLNHIGQLGLCWISPSKARANEVERTPSTNHIVLFRPPATWTRKARHGTQIYEQWQGPKKRTRVNSLVKWDCRWWHKYTKQESKLAFSDTNRNRRLGLSPRSRCARVATGLLKKQEHSL